MSNVPPNCYYRACKHYFDRGKPTWKREDYPIDAEPAWCRAFPGGIPHEIAWGDNPHTEPYPGDHGLRFEKEEEGD